MPRRGRSAETAHHRLVPGLAEFACRAVPVVLLDPGEHALRDGLDEFEADAKALTPGNFRLVRAGTANEDLDIFAKLEAAMLIIDAASPARQVGHLDLPLAAKIGCVGALRISADPIVSARLHSANTDNVRGLALS